MKRSLVGLLFLTALVAACDTPADQPGSAAVRQVLQMSGQPQRLAFSLLTPAERVQAWQLRFDLMRPALDAALAKTDDPVRTALIEEFRSIVSDEANFTGTGDAAPTSALGETVRSWYERARGHLTDIEAFNLTQRLLPLSSLSDTTGLPRGNTPPASKNAAGGGTSPSSNTEYCDEGKCCCHRGSWFTCPKFTATTEEAGVEWRECDNTCHSPTKYGCGFAWLYSCNGMVCVTPT